MKPRTNVKQYFRFWPITLRHKYIKYNDWRKFYAACKHRSRSLYVRSMLLLTVDTIVLTT